MISKQAFGRTEHRSTRVIFGAYALSEATQAEAEPVLPFLLEHGVNHIDTAPTYGKAEVRIGPWLENHRADFFIATKTLDAAERFAARPSDAEMAAHARDFDIQPIFR